MSCLSRIAAKLRKNLHTQGIKEPNRLKNEVYRLNFEKDKVTQAEQHIQKLKGQIDKVEAEKFNNEQDLVRFKENEEKRRQTLTEAKVQQELVNQKKLEAVNLKREEMNQNISEQEKAQESQQVMIAKLQQTKWTLSEELERHERHLQELTSRNQTELEGLRKELDELKSKHKEIKDKQTMTLKKTQTLIEKQTFQ